MTFGDLLVPAYHGIWDALVSGRVREGWIAGGRGSIKSTFSSYLAPAVVMASPGVNAMVCRKQQVDVKSSVYPAVKEAIGRLDMLAPQAGIWRRWSFRKDATRMDFDGARSIVFHGLDDSTRRKSEMPPLGGYYKFLWLEELTEFDGTEELSSLRKSILRGGGGCFSVYTYNPPKSSAAWVNAEASVAKASKRLWKTTWLDVLPYHPEWLGETFIEDAREQERADPVGYRHEMLGEATGTGGEIFANVVTEEIGDEKIARFKERGQCRYGLDFGFTNDPSALTMEAVDENGDIWIWGSDGGRGMFEEDIAAMLARHGLTDEPINADSAEPRAIAKLRQLGVRRIHPCHKAPGWPEDGMRYMRSTRRRIHVDSRRAPDAHRELTHYEYDRYKDGTYHTAYPDRDNHWIDAARYGLEPDVMRSVERRIVMPRAFQRKR